MVDTQVFYRPSGGGSGAQVAGCTPWQVVSEGVFVMAEQLFRGEHIVSDWRRLVPGADHSVGIDAQYHACFNSRPFIARWLNQATDHMPDDKACAFVRDIFADVSGQAVLVMGELAMVGKARFDIVDVTCYSPDEGTTSYGAPVSRYAVVAHRCFVLHFNGYEQ